MNELVVLNYNIWFDNHFREERLTSLISLINKLRPDIICLHEVIPTVYNRLKSKLLKYNFNYPKTIESSYDSVILSRYPIYDQKTYPFVSNMNRNLHVVTIEYPVKRNFNGNLTFDHVPIQIATSHYESEFNEINKIKMDQYETTNNTLNNCKNIILCADLNILDHEEKDCKLINEYWIDSWINKGNKKNQYTYNSDTNIYLKNKNFKYMSRLDRILYHGSNIKLNHFNTTVTNKTLEPSDHYGIVSKFEIK